MSVMRLLVVVPALCTMLSFQAVAQAAWYSGGNLHNAPLTGWLVAKPVNRLATAADFSVAYFKNTQREFDEPTLRRFSEQLVECITAAAQGDGALSEVSASMAASVCLYAREQR